MSHTAANSHGTDRAERGFTPSELIAEFRALRASVLRLWTESRGEFTRANLRDVMRFNEALDQMLAESATRYSQDIDRATDLFIGMLGHDLRNPLGAIKMSATGMIAKDGRRVVAREDRVSDPERRLAHGRLDRRSRRLHEKPTR